MIMQSQAQALRQTPVSPGETAKFWREPRYGGLECLAACFRTHAYKLHTHETYAIGTITAGCERFRVAGSYHDACAGDVVFVNPEVAHDGRPADRGYAYRMIYPGVELIADIAHDLTGRAPRGTVSFPAAVVHDPELSDALVRAHRALQQRRAALLADEAMMQVLAGMLSRHGRLAVPDRPASEPRAVRRAKDYLLAHIADNVDLATLAAVSGLSRWHLIRAFKQGTGLTPHAFVIDRRVRLARTLLLAGDRAVAVAAAAGFADQAHLTRAFKARIGVTPGRFARTT